MIHRTCQGEEPSGGAEEGRSIIQMGDLFVEYSGDPPDDAELEAHLRPPPKDDAVQELCAFLVKKGVVKADELKAALQETPDAAAIGDKIDNG